MSELGEFIKFFNLKFRDRKSEGSINEEEFTDFFSPNFDQMIRLWNCK